MSEELVPCVLCGHRVGASTVLTHVCDASDTSSLRAELAEAQAEIARLTEERDEMRRDFSELVVQSRRDYLAEFDRRGTIVEAVTALVPEWNALDYDVRCTVYGDRPRLVEAADALVAAVEEGRKT